MNEEKWELTVETFEDRLPFNIMMKGELKDVLNEIEKEFKNENNWDNGEPRNIRTIRIHRKEI